MTEKNTRDETSVPAKRLLIAATIAPTVAGFLLPFADHFRQLGWRVDAAASGITNNDRARDAFDNVFDLDWTRSPTDLANYTKASSALRELVAREGYDLVHLHTPIASFAGRFGLRKLRRRGRVAVVYTAHGFHFHEHGSPLRNRVFRSAEKLAGRWTDHLVTINQYDYEQASRSRFVAADDLSLIPGIGIDTAEWDPARISAEETGRVRTELGISQDEQLILLIASHEPEKHHDLALRAFARVRGETAHLAFAGEGPLMEQNRQLANELGVGKRVHFLGNRNDIPALIRASAMTLSTSRREGMSRSVMESLSLAVPAVGSRIRGVHDLIGEDECGIAVEVGDVAGFANAMQRLCDSADLREQMGAAGRRRIAAYDLATVLDAYAAVYEKALERGRRHA